VLSVIALHLALASSYEGISFDTLRMITETSEPGEFYWRLKSSGAFSSKSLPLYMRLLGDDAVAKVKEPTLEPTTTKVKMEGQAATNKKVLNVRKTSDPVPKT
jgi:hypothetical protein